MKLLTGLFSALALMFLPASPAQAQFSETFVSHLGSDSNDCTGLSPCQQFTRAFSQTVVNGQINCLDSRTQTSSSTHRRV